MTALVFLDRNPDLNLDVVMSRRDVTRASMTYLRRGERVRLRDILHLALVASDNAAARALARVSGWGTKVFVEQMNQKAAELGLHSTVFADPSGLDKGNTSTAYDLSRLIAHASEQQKLAHIMRKPFYQMHTSTPADVSYRCGTLIGCSIGASWWRAARPVTSMRRATVWRP